MKFLSIKKILFSIILLFSFSLLFSGTEVEQNDSLESPLSLTASDGAGLVIKSYESNTVLDGFIAFTEIKLSFYNPENRQREGRFRITLPENAHLARFAMQINEKWQEGEVVEKEKAVRVYEDFLHRKQDPALLESDAGNEFSARIFPIPPKADKNIIISYSVSLSDSPPNYTIPLHGLPEIENFKLTVIYDEKEFQTPGSKTISSDNKESSTINRKVFSLKKINYKPDKNISFEHPKKENLYLKNDKFFAFHFIPFKNNKEKFKSDKYVFLVDTSASASPNYDFHIEKIEDLIRQLSIEDAQIFGYDNELTYYGKPSEAISKLKKRLPLGASDLHKALKGISSKLEYSEARLIISSDLVATSGILEKSKIAELLKSQKWITRIDVLIPTAYKDISMIKSVILAGKNPGTYAQLGIDTEEIMEKLRAKVFTNNKISIQNTSWFYPESIDSIQSGEPVIVYGELKDPKDDPSKLIKFNNSNIENFTFEQVDELLLEREAMAARINRLIYLSENEGNEDVQNGLTLQAKELSIKHRVQCAYTSFLVLETEADYARFQISRNSLTNILTIGPAGLEVINRRNSKYYEFLDENRRTETRKDEEQNNVSQKESPKRMENNKGKGNQTYIKATEGASDDDSSLRDEREEDIPQSEPKRIESPGTSTSALSKKSSESKTSKQTDEFISSDSKRSESKKDLEPSEKKPVPTRDKQDKKEISKEISGKSKSKVIDSDEPKKEEPLPEPEHPERTVRKLESIRQNRPPVRQDSDEKHERIEPYTGNMKKFYAMLDGKNYKKAYEFALNWRTKNPEEALALIALGDAYDKLGDKTSAIRAYTSLIDYFPMRADIRRWVGEKLMSINEYDDSIDTLKIALKQRPDHPSSYHLLAIAYIRNKEYTNAAKVALSGINYQFDGRFGAVHDILYDDLDLAYSVTIKTKSNDIEFFKKIKNEYRLRELSNEIRFVLVWETDANDVDFHIYDKYGNHAFFSAMQLASGGELYADLTGGYGPECFRIIHPEAYPYKLEAHYYSRGPMGYGMGALQIIYYNGDRVFSIETRSYLIMNDGAFLNLGGVNN